MPTILDGHTYGIFTRLGHLLSVHFVYDYLVFRAFFMIPYYVDKTGNFWLGRQSTIVWFSVEVALFTSKGIRDYVNMIVSNS